MGHGLGLCVTQPWAGVEGQVPHGQKRRSCSRVHVDLGSGAFSGWGPGHCGVLSNKLASTNSMPDASPVVTAMRVLRCHPVSPGETP